MSYPVTNAGGCVDIIHVDESQIVRPAPNDSVSLSCEIEKPCFTIRNGYWNPVRKCYTVKFPNAIEIKSSDKIKLTIRVPRTIKGEIYEYQIPDEDDWQGDYDTWLNTVDIDAFISGTEKCEHLLAGDEYEGSGSATEKAVVHCGWIEFTACFVVTENLGDVCEFEYSICFKQTRLISHTKECECSRERETEQIYYNCDPCVVLTAAPEPDTVSVG